MRFYLSELGGDGLNPATAWYPVTMDLQSTKMHCCDTRYIGNTTGQYLIWTNNTDTEHGNLIADPRITYLPFDTDLEDRFSNANDQTGIINILNSFHVPTYNINQGTRVKAVMRRFIRRMLLRDMLKEVQPDGSVISYDLTETFTSDINNINPAKKQKITDILSRNSINFNGNNVQNAIERTTANKIAMLWVKEI